MFQIVPLTDETRHLVATFMSESWGAPKMVTRGRIHRADRLPGYAAILDGSVIGLITYDLSGSQCEIVSLDSSLQLRGIGTALTKCVIETATQAGSSRVWLVTTNDNTKALRFWQRLGFTINAVHLYAIQESRRLKPQIPLTGCDGIPILHEIELEMPLD